MSLRVNFLPPRDESQRTPCDFLPSFRANWNSQTREQAQRVCECVLMTAAWVCRTMFLQHHPTGMFFPLHTSLPPPLPGREGWHLTAKACSRHPTKLTVGWGRGGKVEKEQGQVKMEEEKVGGKKCNCGEEAKLKNKSRDGREKLKHQKV